MFAPEYSWFSIAFEGNLRANMLIYRVNDGSNKSERPACRS